MKRLAAFGALVAILAFVLGGWPGVAHVLVYVAATIPGWPIGFRTFGRRHAAGWVAGSLLGYAITCLTLAVFDPHSSAEEAKEDSIR